MKRWGYRCLLAAATTLAATHIVVAFAEDDTKARLEACAAITEPDKRLACYDRLVRELTGGTSSQAAASSNPVSPKQVSETPASVSETEAPAKTLEADARKDFGLDRPAPGKDLREIAVTIVGARRGPRGKWILDTQDGQIWRQSESRRYQLPDLPFQATIKKRRFGGYFMVARTFRSGMSVNREQ